MKSLLRIWTSAAVAVVVGLSCTKNDETVSPQSTSEIKRYQLSVPLEDGRKFIEINPQVPVRMSIQQVPPTSTFLQIKAPDQAYLNTTKLIKIKNPGDFSIINCIADDFLKVTFTDSVRRMPGYPAGWTTVWNDKPNVEHEAPPVLYTRQQNRLTLQLSKYVTTFGFEPAPNQYNAFPFIAGFYDSRENPQVAYVQEIASTPNGAKLFAVHSQRPFNVVEIAFALNGENVNHPYGFAITNIRYKLAK